MGLGITHLLIGISKVIQHRHSVRVYWVHIAWTVNILIYILVIWWGMFWWGSLQEWSFFHFLFVTLYAIVLFLLAALLYPWRIPNDFDFKHHFLENRSWFFGVNVLAWCIDVPETVLKAEAGLRDLPQYYFVFIAVILPLTLIGAFTSNPRYHSIFAPFWFLFILSYLGFTTLAKIATQ
jgi:Ca2+/Na+ antiporter